uniref:Uncharacterized protein n=1 Tax=Callorhinchus milii TaxID=7868 RepID=A0A4W3I2Q0_CALMI
MSSVDRQQKLLFSLSHSNWSFKEHTQRARMLSRRRSVTRSRASGASVVAIDNKIEQAMDLVKSHLMYAVREEVEVLKEQIKELIERNCSLERENSLLKSLTNNDQLSQLQIQPSNPSSTSQPQQPTAVAQAPASTQQTQPPPQPNVSSA